jgi:hypothetical protein
MNPGATHVEPAASLTRNPVQYSGMIMLFPSSLWFVQFT